MNEAWSCLRIPLRSRILRKLVSDLSPTWIKYACTRHSSGEDWTWRVFRRVSYLSSAWNVERVWYN